jgi:poly(3-hydroxybutyrate) depolymerase
VDPCCKGLITHSREEWGALARSGRPGYQGRRPRVSIWHGMDDELLNAVNLDYEREQWTSAIGIDDKADGFKLADGYAGILYQDTAGTTLVETFTIPRLGHAVALDLRPTSPACGKAGPYATDAHLCAAAWIARWFGILP